MTYTDINATRPEGKPQARRCTKCGEGKAETDFYRDASRPSGRYPHCKQCQKPYHAAYNKRHWKANRAELAARNKAYVEANRAARTAYAKQYQQNHQEEIKRYRDAYNAAHREEQRARCKARYAAYYPAHRDEFAIKATNSKARRRGANGTITLTEWKSVLERCGHKCLCCGTSDNLTMDHIVPISLGGLHTVENVQGLCGTCNRRKHKKVIDYRQEAANVGN